MLSEESDLKIVTTLHGTDITLVGLHPSFHAITRFSILRSHGLTAVSEFLKRETVRDFTVPEQRVEVIPNFVDTAVYRPGLEAYRREALAPEGEKIVMHISNFRAVKRAQDVVAIFAQLTAKHPSRLVLIGDGPERSRVLMRADELGVRDRVLFLGKHTSVYELLSCADLFLLPSASESFGLVALEAMACGVPVVASNVGGLPEVIEHGTTGYMFDVGDLDGMAEAGLCIIGDDDHRRSLPEASRALAEERFSARRVVPLYERYYEQVLGAPQ
jgi:N-acetyl-alpha-D-glucosaminyl L-malate synthase BshA